MDATHRTEADRPTARIHSLDAYRGVLMLLGIVLHGASPFMHGGNDISKGVVQFSFGLCTYFVCRLSLCYQFFLVPSYGSDTVLAACS